MKKLGELIREKRKENGWTMAHLSKKINTSQATISQIENHVRAPKDEHMTELAQLFELGEEEHNEWITLQQNFVKPDPVKPKTTSKNKNAPVAIQEEKSKDEKKEIPSNEFHISLELYPGYTTNLSVTTVPLSEEITEQSPMMKDLIQQSILEFINEQLEGNQIEMINYVKEKLLEQVLELENFAETIEKKTEHENQNTDQNKDLVHST
ncbi:helix-turn-helix transcriptional regulator (plasmid) [Pontibacillus sp. ALD_SL1]|uniref:helix-turn-helix domain-containing protein n=1 Tax=Pontibacillus sp. ALD_SL1 TaxID=2777185 RepID=UPI001A956B59|nr:helix-turn-helix transcriptional regulator [Pontibacillus sp. ALD_SL1]QST02092.1 helix-turn-helix transcriptional regulator [Pontibacillus sp. ALD_SL1]